MLDNCPDCGDFHHHITNFCGPGVLRLRISLSPTSCLTCKFLYELVTYRNPIDPDCEVYYLQFIRSGRSGKSKVFQLDSVYDRNTHTFAVHQSELGPEEGYGFVRTCLDFCQQNHGAYCARDNRISLPGLRLIDVETEAVVGVSSKDRVASAQLPYVALSYVWGSSPSEPQEDYLEQEVGEGLTRLPAVVQDAMTVCKDLGFRYLWVDKYCINQSNADEKHDQIQNMDRIYSAAELTIIAAGSESCSEGLHGVSRPRAAPCRIGKLTFTPMHELVFDDILKSKWNTRGWTYQEAILSRRVLVFTSGQYYFQCGATHRLELSPFDPRLDGRPNECFDTDDRFPVPLFPLLKSNLSLQERGHEPLEAIIDEYCTRQLSFDTDRLNAIAGILHRFQHTFAAFQFFFGMPLRSSREFSNNTAALTRALSWSKAYDIDTRVLHFPSWSWLGWKRKGTEAHPTSKRQQQSFSIRAVSDVKPWIPGLKNHYPLVDVEVNFIGKRRLYSWEKEMYIVLEMANRGSPVDALVLHGWTLEIDLRTEVIHWSDGQIWFEKEDYIHTNPPDNGLPSTVRCTGILVHLQVDSPESDSSCRYRNTYEQYSTTRFGIMLIRQTQEQAATPTYTRCGWIHAARDLRPHQTYLSTKDLIGEDFSPAIVFESTQSIRAFKKEVVVLK
ncbi:heterokaryon incompatibility protein-domain-containing protein [Apiospora arundinis]|uniref:Heterokaryon incompatibility protein-domain-containing protein n=1 Tax=Apiospora arundinis TaxID=335852 RepID=A0ABR2JIA6_9PEZI